MDLLGVPDGTALRPLSVAPIVILAAAACCNEGPALYRFTSD